MNEIPLKPPVIISLEDTVPVCHPDPVPATKGGNVKWVCYEHAWEVEFPAGTPVDPLFKHGEAGQVERVKVKDDAKPNPYKYTVRVNEPPWRETDPILMIEE